MADLNQDQVARLGRALAQRRRMLLDEIRAGLLRSGAAHHKDMAGMVADAGDDSVANMLEDLEIAEVERDVRELREVEQALARVADGSYGACADCGGPIGYARLEANPAATRCIACQTRREHGYRHGGTPTL